MPKRKKPTRDVGGDDGSPCPDGATETTATTLAVDADAHPDDFTASLNNYHSLPAAARRDLAAARAVRGVFFGVEPSSSSRSLCKGCRRPIAAGTLRFRHVVCGRNCCSEKRTGVRDACGRWHVDCLLEAQATSPNPFMQCSPGWRPIEATSQLVGFGNLSKAHQDAIREAITNAKDATPVKRETKKARKQG